MNKLRRKSRRIMIGSVPLGGGAPVSVQSMTNTDTRDAGSTLAQINELSKFGCEIVRVAVPDRAAVNALPEILAESTIPVLADVHFDHRLALGAIAAGVHGVRLNPGNIGGNDAVRAVAEAAGNAGIPIRVGANSGSLPKKLLAKKGGLPLSELLCRSALAQCRMLEEFGFSAIKVSLKASSVTETVAACRKFASETDYPLHLGVTEAGTMAGGIIKSAVGVGALLLDGIGDTIRISLTAAPVEEVRVAIRILEAVGLREANPEIISCPSCGRTEINLLELAAKVESEVERLKAEGGNFEGMKLAVMGCVVNGPGEASDADLGIAGGKGIATVFRCGERIGTWPESEAFDVFIRELREFGLHSRY